MKKEFTEDPPMPTVAVGELKAVLLKNNYILRSTTVENGLTGQNMSSVLEVWTNDQLGLAVSCKRDFVDKMLVQVLTISGQPVTPSMRLFADPNILGAMLDEMTRTVNKTRR